MAVWGNRRNGVSDGCDRDSAARLRLRRRAGATRRSNVGPSFEPVPTPACSLGANAEKAGKNRSSHLVRNLCRRLLVIFPVKGLDIEFVQLSQNFLRDRRV